MSRMVETFKNFIGGAWKSSRSGATFENENPAFRGSNLGLFQSSTVDDVAEAIAAAAAAFGAWRRLPVAARQERIAAFLRLLEESREELARIVTVENGKTIRESLAEVDSALVEGRYHLTQVSAFHGHTGPGTVRDVSTWVQYEPVGVEGVELLRGQHIPILAPSGWTVPTGSDDAVPGPGRRDRPDRAARREPLVNRQ